MFKLSFRILYQIPFYLVRQDTLQVQMKRLFFRHQINQWTKWYILEILLPWLQVLKLWLIGSPCALVWTHWSLFVHSEMSNSSYFYFWYPMFQLYQTVYLIVIIPLILLNFGFLTRYEWVKTRNRFLANFSRSTWHLIFLCQFPISPHSSSFKVVSNSQKCILENIPHHIIIQNISLLLRILW